MPKFFRITNHHSPFTIHHLLTEGQKGFSALPFFLLGLALLILMSAVGFFDHPKSVVTDQNVYHATGANTTKGKDGLRMTNLNFETPTQPPVPTTVQPTVPAIPTFPPGNYCKPDTPKGNCDCLPTERIALFCGGSLPPALPLCYQDMLGCDDEKAKDPSCFYVCYGKPVIYLYPTHPMFVDVTVSNSQIIQSIPQIENGQTWTDVFAMPGGILKYQNNYYRELFYESQTRELNPPDNGLFIKTENLKLELKTLTERLGLLPYESQEFVDYWTPRLQALHKTYIFFSILSKDEKERTDKVDIKPAPDNFLQFLAYFKGVDNVFETKPFVFPNVPPRTGFTAVEWGGVIDREQGTGTSEFIVNNRY